MPNHTLPGSPRRLADAATYLLLSAGAAIMIAPFAWQILTAFKTPAEALRVPPTLLPDQWSLTNFTTALSSIPFGAQLMTSIASVGVRSVGQALFCALAGYAFARLMFPGKNILFLAILAILMVPSQLYLLPQYEIMSAWGILNSLPALIIPGIFSAFGTFLMRQFFMSLPRELEEAAKIDGAGHFRTFWVIMLPLAKPGLITLTIFTALYSWNELLWPLIVNNDPSTLNLSAGLSFLVGQYSTNYPVLMAGALMAQVPMVLLFLLLQKQFINGIAFTGGK
ncbi:sugar ABC transporter permease [Microbacterium sp. Y-01]|uniref:carbohydrate ABC transporter permease n=1 Tax=Microbacterium sp. Y-01 TaxID=2048898 RepID=UPI000F600B89|nr:carbohydrate ABC transporter permease [Microbacterium sp. Y-01]AZH79329.1 sugar ABC transporter permease [Microbacterium sp. Y-01]